MIIKNGRFIIKEENLDKELKQIERRVNKIFKDFKWERECHVECYEEFNGHRGWLTLLINSDPFQISYMTETIQPTLVKNGKEFDFYYVFEFAGSGSTNPTTWENTGFSPIENESDTVEDIVWEILVGYRK